VQRTPDSRFCFNSGVTGAGSVIRDVGILDMAETQSSPKRKPSGRLVLRIYAAVCTMLVSAWIAHQLWGVLFQKSVPPATGSGKAVSTAGYGSYTSFQGAYGKYMTAEYPKRGSLFQSMAGALREFVAEAPLVEADLFKYLGRPDQYYRTNEVVSKPVQLLVTNEIVCFAYLFDRPGETNRWAATAILADGKVQDIGFSDASANERSGFQAFPVDSDPKQGGANGRQPVSPETNPASAAAASRRSP
jgi:hypothetical protein